MTMFQACFARLTQAEIPEPEILIYLCIQLDSGIMWEFSHHTCVSAALESRDASIAQILEFGISGGSAWLEAHGIRTNLKTF